jgi:predicted amidophosphoribosyltransferase
MAITFGTFVARTIPDLACTPIYNGGMLCPACAQPVESNADLCLACGEPLRTPTSAAAGPTVLDPAIEASTGAPRRQPRPVDEGRFRCPGCGAWNDTGVGRCRGCGDRFKSHS